MSQYNSILSLIPDWIVLESTFWDLKDIFCTIVNLNKFMVYVYYTCTTGMRTALGMEVLAETVW